MERPKGSSQKARREVVSLQAVGVAQQCEIAGVPGSASISPGYQEPSLTHSLLTEADAGHTEFTDEVYQNETRYPGGEWKAAEDTYTDAVSHLHAPSLHHETQRCSTLSSLCIPGSK